MTNKFLFFFLFLTFLFSCKNEYRQGGRLYEHYCSSCHMTDGSGLVGAIPPLLSSDYLVNHYDNLACIIKYGLFDTIQVNGKEYNDIMVGIPDLNEVQISNIMNYISHTFIQESDVQKYTVQEIDSILNSCKISFKKQLN